MASPRRILLLHSDESCCTRLIRLCEQTQEFVTCCTAEGDTLAECIRQDAADIYLVGGESGAEILARCEKLAQQVTTAPIVAVMPQADTAATAAVLDAGAIDCIDPDLHPAVLRARLRAHLRVRDAAYGAPRPIGHCLLQPDRRRIVCHRTGRHVALTRKEVDILRTLQKARGPVTRGELLCRVWSLHRHVETNTIETHIYRLRRKLVAIGLADVIATEGGGYRLVR